MGTEPAKIPIWDSNQTLVLPPTGAQETDGWTAPGGIPVKPGIQYFNGWQNNVYLWIDHLNTRLIESGTFLDSGSANDYDLARADESIYEISSLTDGMEIIFKAATTNTGASTADLLGQTGIDITLDDGTTLPAGAIKAGKYTLTIYNDAESRLEIAQLTLIGAIGTSVNNSNGNPNISNSHFNIEGNITTSQWKSIGPTGSSPDYEWVAMNAIPNGVDWIEIRVRVQGSLTSGASGRVSIIVNVRKAGSSEGDDVGNMILYTNDEATDSAKAAAAGIVKDKVGVDSSNRFDLHWENDYAAGSTTATIILVGWGYNN